MIWRPWRECRRLRVELSNSQERASVLQLLFQDANSLLSEARRLCSNRGDGRPCILPKGHDGKHFAYSRGVWE